MNPDRRHSRPASAPRAQRGAASPWIFAGFLVVAGFFFFTEHRAHLMGALPFILLALCPLMHLLHRRHGRHRHGSGTSDEHARGTPAASRSSQAAPPASPHPPHTR
jgi:hypothetical protein